MAHEMEKFTLIAPWSFKCIITHSLIIHCSDVVPDRPDHPPFSIQMSPINLSMLECPSRHPEKEAITKQRNNSHVYLLTILVGVLTKKVLEMGCLLSSWIMVFMMCVDALCRRLETQKGGSSTFNHCCFDIQRHHRVPFTVVGKSILKSHFSLKFEKI